MLSGLQLIQYDDGRFCLMVMEPGAPEDWYLEEFDARGLQGGGYTWEGLLGWLISARLPELVEAVIVDAEADNAWIDAADRGALGSRR
jgi:hypothetical protein